jgi:xanthine dehydrogenase FAD-binding subunit
MSVVENYVAPQCIEDAAAVLAAGSVTIVAGGTDLMIQGKADKSKYEPTLMNVRHIAEMRDVSVEGDALQIGALTTITDLLTDKIIAEHLPVLADMADKFASNQIRNAGTVGGNICNASPAGDSLVPLLMYEAEAVLVSIEGRRKVPLAKFFTGPGKTILQNNELLTSVEIAIPPDGFVGGFGKFGPRPALEIAMASVSLGGVVKNGTISNVRVAFGAVAPTPIRGPKTEAALEGSALDDETIRAAAEIARSEVRPISDVRATDWYRKHLISVMTEEILNNVR